MWHRVGVSIYAVILKQPDAVAWEKIRERWPDYHYFLSETAAFVAVAGISTIEQIRDEIGLNSTQRINGVLVEVLTYGGYSDTALGAWLKKAQEV